MSVWQAIILGIIQGLTEFLPISSSAHLIIVPWLFGWGGSGLAFDVALHIGTLVAVLLYFRRDLAAMAIALPRGILSGQGLTDPMARLALIILIGSVPAGVVGLLAEDYIDSYFHARQMGDGPIVIIALLLIGLGAVLWLAERVAHHQRPILSLGARDGLLIGAAQALALLPGVSRSGSTITAGLLVGLKRDAAARFSFLLGVPAVVGAGLLQMVELAQTGLAAEDRIAFGIGMFTAAVVGYLAIAFLLRYLQRRSTMVFVVYRFGFGVLLLLLVLSGLR